MPLSSGKLYPIQFARFLSLLHRPDRWDHLPEAASSVPGVWSNLFSFLAGPRSCIGYRFAIAEHVYEPVFELEY